MTARKIPGATHRGLLDDGFESRRIERIRDAIAAIDGKEIADIRCALVELLDEYGGDPLHHYQAAMERGDVDHARAIHRQCVSIGLWRARQESGTNGPATDRKSDSAGQ